MKHFEEKLREKTCYEGRIFRVTEDEVRLENGATAPREVVHHHGGACIAALTETDEIYLVRQYRYPFARELWELPAGKLERGEDPFEAAKRELAEECGLRAASYQPLGELYPTVGYCTEVIYTYLATDLQPCEMKLDEDEFLTPEKIPFTRAVEMVLSGEIQDAKTVAGILKIAALWRQNADRGDGCNV